MKNEKAKAERNCTQMKCENVKLRNELPKRYAIMPRATCNRAYACAASVECKGCLLQMCPRSPNQKSKQ